MRPARPARAIALLLLACAAAASVACADELTLTNGDRLTGKVVRIEGGKLFFKPDYAREMQIDLKTVHTLETTEPVSVHLKDETVLKGRAHLSGDGLLEIENAALFGPVVVDWGQVKAVNPPPVAWHGSAVLGGVRHSGNVDDASVSAALDATLRSEKNRFRAKVLYNYAETEGIMTARNTYTQAKYDYFLVWRLYAYTANETLSDRFRDLSLRTVSGAGLGYDFLDRPDVFLEVEGGGAYVNENYIDAEDKEYFTARGSLRLRWTILGRVTLADEYSYLPDVGTNNYLMRNEASIGSPLGAGWSLKLSNVIDFNSEPPDDRRRTDTQWVLGLQYQF